MASTLLSWPTFAPAATRGGTVTVGNFDGVHLGHRALLTAAKAMNRGPVVAVTFDPAPLVLLNPAAAKPPLTTTEEKIRLLRGAGADHVVVLNTEPSLLALSPEAFFEDVLRDMLGARAVVEGYDFRFGRGRTGNNTDLKTLCDIHNVGFAEVPPLLHHGEVVSSSRIRAALIAGHIETANGLLHRRYSLTGTVVAGAKRGRTLGFPTANLDRVTTLVPGTGVYAVVASVNSRQYAGAANIGPNPTFGEDARKIEVHLLDFAEEIYGQEMTVRLVQKLRETVAFSGLDALKAQLARDVARAGELAASIMATPGEDLP
jgi:riboflavin kinase/FMN adenylyltransferase